MPPVLTLEQVREIIEKEGCTLVSKEYNGSKKDIEIRCTCQPPDSTVVFTTSFQSFRLGARCATCTNNKRKATNKAKTGFEFNSQNPTKKDAVMRGLRVLNEENRYTVNEVADLMEKAGCMLRSKEYVNRMVPLDVEFKCGCIGTITLDKFIAGHRCSTFRCIATRQKDKTRAVN